jgi:hypothetical protein
MNTLFEILFKKAFEYEKIEKLFEEYLPIFESLCPIDCIEWEDIYSDDFDDVDALKQTLLSNLMSNALRLNYLPHCEDRFIIAYEGVVEYEPDYSVDDISLIKKDLDKFESLTGIRVEIL